MTDTAIKPPEPILTIRIFAPSVGTDWLADLTNFAGKELASATAPEWQAVWDMIATAIEREIGEVGE